MVVHGTYIQNKVILNIQKNISNNISMSLFNTKRYNDLYHNGIVIDKKDIFQLYSINTSTVQTYYSFISFLKVHSETEITFS